MFNYKKKIAGEARCKMVIYRILWKHGSSGFILEILEYCYLKDAIIRKKHYLYLLKASYNKLNIAYSSLGHRYTKEAIDKMRAAEGNLSEEIKAKLRKI